MSISSPYNFDPRSTPKIPIPSQPMETVVDTTPVDATVPDPPAPVMVTSGPIVNLPTPPNPLPNLPKVAFLTSFFDFLGSANVQKAFGIAQVIIGGSGVEGTVWWQKLSCMTIGGVFTSAIHYFDYLRTK